VADIDVKGINLSPRVSDIPARSDDATIRVQSKDDAARQHQRLCDGRLLVGLSVMSIMLGAAPPVWQTAIKCEREAELIFRGEQYAQAISLFNDDSLAIPAPYDSFIHCTSPV
jgi:hypothetical protein